MCTLLAVVKTPRTEISIHGDGAAEILDYLQKGFNVEILSTDEDDDSVVKVQESCYWRTAFTPGSLLMGFRLKHDLTQNDLAERSGIAQVMISEYETGKRKLTMKAASKFAKALGEAPEKFFP